MFNNPEDACVSMLSSTKKKIYGKVWNDNSEYEKNLQLYWSQDKYVFVSMSLINQWTENSSH